jgi:hypothetical protein
MTKMGEVWRSIAALARCGVGGVAIGANAEDEIPDGQRFYVAVRSKRVVPHPLGFATPETALVMTHRHLLEQAERGIAEWRDIIDTAASLDTEETAL